MIVNLNNDIIPFSVADWESPDEPVCTVGGVLLMKSRAHWAAVDLVVLPIATDRVCVFKQGYC